MGWTLRRWFRPERLMSLAGRPAFWIVLTLIVHAAGRVGAVCAPARFDSFVYSVAAYKFFDPHATSDDLVPDKPGGQALLTGWSCRLIPGPPTRLALIPIETLFMLAGYLVFGLIACRFLGRPSAAFLTFLLALGINTYNTLDSSVAGLNVNETYLLLPMVLAVGAHLAIERPGRRGFMAGLAIGTALTIKQTAAGLWVVLFLLSLRPGLRRAWRGESLRDSDRRCGTGFQPGDWTGKMPVPHKVFPPTDDRLDRLEAGPTPVLGQALTVRPETRVGPPVCRPGRASSRSDFRVLGCTPSAAAALLAGTVAAWLPLLLYLHVRGWLWPHWADLVHLSGRHMAWMPLSIPPGFKLVPLLPAVWFVAAGLVAWMAEGKRVKGSLLPERPEGREKGVGSLLPERPEGCFAQKTPDPLYPRRDVVVVAGLWLLVESVMLWAMTKRSAHYYQQLVPPAVLLAGVGLAALNARVNGSAFSPRMAARRWLGAVGAAIVIVACMPLGSEVSRRVGRFDYTREVRDFDSWLAHWSPRTLADRPALPEGRPGEGDRPLLPGR